MTPRWLRRLLGDPPPEGFDGRLGNDERVLGSAPAAGGRHLVVTTLGLWVPDTAAEVEDAGAVWYRRIGWHMISKATWNGRVLTVIEADEVGTEHDAVLIADREPRRFTLPEPAKVPELVHARVTRSVLHSERADGGDLVVRRKVPGRDGVRVQIRRRRTGA
ncbi:MAG TPA: hypothetical protein VGJ95_16690 [Pseudonocardiaceae bacterium]|jgi:hypothetical protein